jgi:hypothetical protein
MNSRGLHRLERIDLTGNPKWCDQNAMPLSVSGETHRANLCLTF